MLFGNTKVSWDVLKVKGTMLPLCWVHHFPRSRSSLLMIPQGGLYCFLFNYGRFLSVILPNPWEGISIILSVKDNHHPFKPYLSLDAHLLQECSHGLYSGKTGYSTGMWHIYSIYKNTSYEIRGRGISYNK